MVLPQSVDLIISEFTRFPGIGRKTAERLAYFLIFQEQQFTDHFTENIKTARSAIRFCEICGNLTEEAICSICTNPDRDQTSLCIVESPKDLIAIESTDVYHGLYHILGGALAPIEGVTPEKLNLSNLRERIEKGVKEVVIATNSTVSGEMTSLYIKKMLNQFNVNITRIAKGIPFGSDLEYADKITIANAFRGRQNLKDEFTQSNNVI